MVNKGIVLMALLAAALLAFVWGYAPRKSQLSRVPVTTVAWHAPFPHMASPPWIWKTVTPTGCRISRPEALRSAIARYPAKLHIPQTIFVQRTGLKDANPGDGNPACSYVVDFSGPNLGVVSHDGSPPAGASQWVVVVVNGVTGRVGHEIFEGW